MKATPELLAQSIAFAGMNTSPTRPARCLLIVAPSPPDSNSKSTSAGSVIAGLALYFYNYSTWRGAAGIFVEDLFVRAAFRRRGYAGRLLAELGREVEQMRGGRLEWSVLRWNTPSIQFYESERVGARRMEEWVGMRVEGEALRRLAARATGWEKTRA